MKKYIFCLLLLALGWDCHSQLVRKKDYDIAVALQVGGGTSLLFPGQDMKIAVAPVAGLKLTVPFTRKWFLGGEVNYTDLKFDSRYSRKGDGQEGKLEARFRLKQIQIPVYLKYRLNCNKASVLFGGYGSYHIQNKSEAVSPSETVSMPESTLGDAMEKWNVGITLGYEHQIVKHLDIMCRVNVGLREMMQSKEVLGKNVFPLQACITLSYDIFRVGDCGCD